MKKLLYVLIALSLLFVFKYTIYIAIFHDGVNGTKAFSPIVKGELLYNGFRYFELRNPILYFGHQPNWRTCHELSEHTKKSFEFVSNGEIVLNESVDIITDSNPDLVRIYINYKDRLLILDAFEDYGSSPNLVWEICNQWEELELKESKPLKENRY